MLLKRTNTASRASFRAAFEAARTEALTDKAGTGAAGVGSESTGQMQEGSNTTIYADDLSC